MWLANMGLEVLVSLYSVLLSNTIWGLDCLGLALSLIQVRKKEVHELSKIVESELKLMDGPDIGRRASKLYSLQQQIEATDAQKFNNNEEFTEQINKTLGLLPRIGDQLLRRPSRHGAGAEGGFSSREICVFGMIACGPRRPGAVKQPLHFP
jgi:hypothetical protein